MVGRIGHNIVELIRIPVPFIHQMLSVEEAGLCPGITNIDGQIQNVGDRLINNEAIPVVSKNTAP